MHDEEESPLWRILFHSKEDTDTPTGRHRSRQEQKNKLLGESRNDNSGNNNKDDEREEATAAADVDDIDQGKNKSDYKVLTFVWETESFADRHKKAKRDSFPEKEDSVQPTEATDRQSNVHTNVHSHTHTHIQQPQPTLTMAPNPIIGLALVGSNEGQKSTDEKKNGECTGVIVRDEVVTRENRLKARNVPNDDNDNDDDSIAKVPMTMGIVITRQFRC